MITNERFELNDRDRGLLLIIGAAVIVFLTLYFAYSAGKFKSLQTRSRGDSNVVMKVIQHNVNAVCARCGAKGVPICPVCKVKMFWNGYVGNFVCPACGKTGFPICPRCKQQMTWIEIQ